MSRITIDPEKMGGAPCIRGLRIPVTTVVRMVADGMTSEEIIKDFPDLTEDDIALALDYAAAAVSRGTDLDEAIGVRYSTQGKSAALFVFALGLLAGLLLSRVIW